jgi:uncharacterized protein
VKKKYLFLIFVLVSILILIIGIMLIKKIVDKESVCFENNCYFVKIANDDYEREKGLMNVESLDIDKGMFFIFEKEGIYNFWMKNTLIPLDIIWIDEDMIVVHIAKALPCEVLECQVYSSSEEAKYVLEINAGEAERIGLRIGDKAILNP